jgi:DNA-binding response OmpR family regulator
MSRMRLAGHSVLVVEDEPLIALDIADAMRTAGATVLTAQRVADGLRLSCHPGLSAAVVDFGLSDGEGTELCKLLNERGVPFVLYTGFADVDQNVRPGIVIRKPATPYQLVTAVAGLLEAESCPRPG